MRDLIENEQKCNLTFVQLFEAQASLRPDEIAVLCHSGQIKYKSLNEKANQLARVLGRRGVGSEVIVGIFLERSIEMMIGLLAIAKAGGAYVPLDPAYPMDRLEYMIDDAAPKMLLTRRSLADRLSPLRAEVMCIDTDWAVVEREDTSDVESGIRPENLVYVIYTSGSSGRPKGVQVQHASLTNLILSMLREPGVDRQDVLLSLSSLSFDMVVPELFVPLAVGARVILVESRAARNPAQLAHIMRDHGVTVMQATPSTWRMLLDYGWTAPRGMKILSGAEALPVGVAERLIEVTGSLWNLYGPTETTVWSTLSCIQNANEPLSIGRPIANTCVYILDEQLEPVPIGATGELYIGGMGLARGYLNAPARTAERFIASPFGPSGGRLYRTGDRGRYLETGEIEYLGRLDNQVKLRGFRIELGEIEELLRRQIAVLDAVVLLHEDEPGDQRLVAYIEGREDLSLQSLKLSLGQLLPDYMLPAAYVRLESIPRTVNGKVDRSSLLSLQLNSRAGVEGSASLTEVERKISQIAAEILRIEKVELHDNFFQIGGHSILAVVWAMRLKKEFSVEFDVEEVFNNPTASHMASCIERELAVQKSGVPKAATAVEVFQF
jgi:amino acid adenylation domain-containing protein